MSMRLIRMLSVKALFFILVVFLEPSSSRGGLFDEEDDLKERDGRPPTVLQSLVIDFEEVVRGIDSVLYCPDTPSRIQAFVLTFMREQGFSVPSEQKGPASGIGVKKSLLLDRQRDYERSLNIEFSSLSAATEFLNSVRFKDALDDFAYAALLCGWQHKLDPSFPYTHFLEGITHKSSMLVLCSHPLDISASRKFLSLLYEALYRLWKIDQTLSVLEHEGLRNIWKGFLDHSYSAERVVEVWGASLLEQMNQFYREQKVVGRWVYLTRILRVSKDEMTRSLHDTQIRLSRCLETMEGLENCHAVPRTGSIRTTFQWRGLPQEGVELILDAWKEGMLTNMRNPERQRQSAESPKYKVLQQEREVIDGTEDMRSATREYRFLKVEVSSVEIAFAIAEYFSARPEIQFLNPFQVKRDLDLLYLEFSVLSDPRSPALLSLYRALKEMLSFTFSGVDRLIGSREGLPPRRLPPLSFVPHHLQADLVGAYQRERTRLVEISPFAQERRDTKRALIDFKERILAKALTRIDTPDKEQLVALRQGGSAGTFTDDEKRELERLKREIILKEITTGPAHWSLRNLYHRQRAAIAKLAHQKFLARHLIASLNLELEKRRFLLWTMEKSNVGSERITPIQEEVQGLRDDMQKAEARIQDIKRRAKEVTEQYNESTQAMSAVRAPA